MNITKGDWVFKKDGYWCEVQIKDPLKSLCAVNINIEECIENGKLMALAPELLSVCKRALIDVKKMNEWMMENGHHGYTLLEKDLEEVIKKTEL